MFETQKHVPKTEKRCYDFKDNSFICANKIVWYGKMCNDNSNNGLVTN